MKRLSLNFLQRVGNNSNLPGGFLLFALAAALLTMTHGRLILSHLYANAGSVIRSQSLAQLHDVGAAVANARAAGLFRRATLLAEGNRAARRGLGFALAAQGQEEPAILAWSSVPDTELAMEFIARGNDVLDEDAYSEALEWFSRAALVAPTLGDPWYQIGISFESMGQLESAAWAYELGLNAGSLVEVGRSDFHVRLGRLATIQTSPPNWPEALLHYDEALATDEFGEELIEIQTHFLRAEALRRVGRSSEALSEFDWVASRQPTNYTAHVRLGNLIWDLQGDADAAEAMFSRAIEIDNSSKWAFRGLGVLYAATGRNAEAIEMFGKVLDLDPEDGLAQKCHLKIVSECSNG